MATFQLHHQTLITIEYQSTRQEESNEPKLDGVASFNYGVPMATQLHHQTLITIEYQITVRNQAQYSQLSMSGPHVLGSKRSLALRKDLEHTRSQMSVPLLLQCETVGVKTTLRNGVGFKPSGIGIHRDFWLRSLMASTNQACSARANSFYAG
ncbi:hypothetical protein EVAR_81279_1 [Eumeta japonica]|uniref:Uncharacterized protein n=1 Tax=Eumeta variegata TaxID=151549 RepID=A0A4C1WS85_EUMVA|nr:hypothetical protein EVAR_81279_1 [Eumeta japonica]